MSKIRYSEMFYSIQGEGKWIGTPTVFFRTFGCNLECNGFGQKRGQLIPSTDMPHMQINLDDVKSVEDLPVVDMGCDSSASWSKRYKHLSPFAETFDIAQSLDDLISNDKLSFRDNVHLCITGGEPFLGWQKSYIELLQQEQLKGLKHITFETNGSKTVQYNLIKHFNDTDVEVTWMVSPKLSLTGEDQKVTINPQALKTMNEVVGSNINLKFVIRDEEDIDEVYAALNVYAERGVVIENVYLMNEGAILEQQELTHRATAELCMEHGWKYSPRLHINLFGNAWST